MFPYSKMSVVLQFEEDRRLHTLNLLNARFLSAALLLRKILRTQIYDVIDHRCGSFIKNGRGNTNTPKLFI